MPTNEKRPAGNGADSRTSGCTHYIAGLRQRREATYRLPVLESGRADPWHYPPPAAGYADAAHHLLGCGMTPAPDRDGLRAMWRRGGHHRRAAELIAARWELAA